jgi:tetratricopeptide (TPR) repeat protein
MLIGDDFFLSHRIYVANGQRKLYFTYNGGSVFVLTPDLPPSGPPPPAPNASAANLGTGPNGAPPGAAVPAIGANTQTPSAAPVSADEPTDAAGFMRRGTAFAARRDFVHALPDLTRACELAPAEAEYFYERGRVRFQARQVDLALQDFNHALELKPEYAAARLLRAQLRRGMHADVTSDLDALDHLVPPQDDMRLALGVLYESGHGYVAAVHQYDLWIESHGHDVLLVTALNDRCWARAEADRDLDQALKDCNAALRLSKKAAPILDSRGLVYLRRGELDRSISDYNAALALRPNQADSLYGRGLAEMRKGLRQAGQADLEAARARDAQIAERYAGLGLTP